MTPPLSRRLSPRAAIGLAVLVALVAMVFGRAQPQRHAVAAPALQRATPPVQIGEALDPGKLKRQATDEPVPDLFPAPIVRTPTPPPPAPAQRERPATPVAPPLPFRYLGKATEGGKTSVFLGRGTEHYVALVGGVIGADYRVEHVTEHDVTFVYLPLRTHQTLPLPSAEPITIE